MNGGDRVASVLVEQGVRFLFTLCGGHISPILVGAKHRGIRVVDVRHEVDAVFAADAVFRLTGVPGVAAVTAGPGVTNTITAIKNAQLAQSGVVLLGGAAATLLKGRGALQDIDQQALFAPPQVQQVGAAVAEQSPGKGSVVGAAVVAQVDGCAVGAAAGQGAQSVEASAGANRDHRRADVGQQDLQRWIVAAGQSEYPVRFEQASERDHNKQQRTSPQPRRPTAVDS